MSFNTLIGFILSLGLFIGAVLTSTDTPIIFWSFSSFIIVAGGTLASTFLSQEARYVILALKGIASTFLPQRIRRDILNREVGLIIRWGYIAQKSGMVALDQETKKVGRDPYMAYGTEMMLSGYDGEVVRENLYNMLESTYERNTVPANILKQMGAIAPAFGMIGTLVGLIIMLANMGEDPKSLGVGLAVALNTTLYGVLLQRMIFAPSAAKIIQREQINRFRHRLLAEGMALLADRVSPRQIQDRMNSFLDPAIHYDIDKQLKSNAKK